MVDTYEVLAIIPARGGSKGIPRKNIRIFAGHPMITYSIAAAHHSEVVTRTIVSTDDDEIAAVARQYGAEVPFLRPVELAQDNTVDLPVFEHVLNWLSDHESYSPDVVVQLRPTSPLRPRNLVDDAVGLLLSHPEADSVRGVVPAGQNPYKMWRIDPGSGQMAPLLTVDGVPEPYNAPRQNLPPVHWQTGHIDAVRPETILVKKSMSGSVILPLLIDSRYSVDIDTLYDWRRYEWQVWHGGLDMVNPDKQRRTMPEKVDLLVLDFDGVMTDNRVWIDQDGHEEVAANRCDGIGINLIRNAGFKIMVLSTEVNPVVAARCSKLKLPVIQGVEDKLSVLTSYLEEHRIDPKNVIYLGNDINDVPCFSLVGYAVVVADAETSAVRQADLVLTRAGGYGAVRELCDIILQRMEERR